MDAVGSNDMDGAWVGMLSMLSFAGGVGAADTVGRNDIVGAWVGLAVLGFFLQYSYSSQN